MPGLLDYIFSSLDIGNLDHKKTKEYLSYLQEIIPQVHTLKERMQLSRYRVRLTNRLIYLDRTALEDLNKALAENRLSINLKKAQHHLV